MKKAISVIFVLSIISFCLGNAVVRADVFEFGDKLVPPNLRAEEVLLADWVNTAFPWVDNEVSNTLTIGPSSIIDSSLVLAAVDLSSPPPIGDVAPNTIDATALSATGTFTLGGNLDAGTDLTILLGGFGELFMNSVDLRPTANLGMGLGSSSARWMDLWVADVDAAGDIVPSADSTYDLGSLTKAWSTVYADTVQAGGPFLTFENASGAKALEYTQGGPFWEFYGDARPAADSTWDLGANSVAWSSAYIDKVVTDEIQSAGNTLTFYDQVSDMSAQHDTLGNFWAFSDDVNPATDSTYDLGLTGTRWQNGWFDTLLATNQVQVGTDLVDNGVLNVYGDNITSGGKIAIRNAASEDTRNTEFAFEADDELNLSVDGTSVFTVVDETGWFSDATFGAKIFGLNASLTTVDIDSGGNLEIDRSHIEVDAFSGGVDTITSFTWDTAGTSAPLIVLRAGTAQTITVADGANIFLDGNVDFVLDNPLDVIMLIFVNSTQVTELSRSDNG